MGCRAWGGLGVVCVVYDHVGLTSLLLLRIETLNVNRHEEQPSVDLRVHLSDSTAQLCTVGTKLALKVHTHGREVDTKFKRCGFIEENCRSMVPKGGLESLLFYSVFHCFRKNPNKIALFTSAYSAQSALSAFCCALVVTGTHAFLSLRIETEHL